MTITASKIEHDRTAKLMRITG